MLDFMWTKVLWALGLNSDLFIILQIYSWIKQSIEENPTTFLALKFFLEKKIKVIISRKLKQSQFQFQ